MAMRFLLFVLMLLPGISIAASKELLQLPVATEMKETTTWPVYDASTGTQAMTGRVLQRSVLEIHQLSDEPNDTPVLRVYDKTGKLRTTIFVNGSIEIQ